MPQYHMKKSQIILKGSFEHDIFEAASKASTEAQRLAFLRQLYASVHAREHPEVDKFLFDKKYLGFDKTEVRPNIRKVLNLVLMTPDVQKAYILLGKGSGKSWLACIIMAYKLHELTSYIDPARYFGLAQDSTIGIVNMAPGAAQALNVIFNFFTRLVDRIKAFENMQKKKWVDFGDGKESPFRPVRQEDEEEEFSKEKYRQAQAKLFFPEKNLMAVSGHSRAEAFYGYSLFCAGTDETDFLDRKKVRGRMSDVEDQTTQGEEIIQGLESAGVSRFKKKALFFHISTTNAETASLTRRVIRTQTFGKEISLDDGTVVIIPEAERPEDRVKCHRYGGEISIQGATWLFTGGKREDYITDEKSVKELRDYGCIPPSSSSPALPDQEIIWSMCNKDRKSPLTDDQKAFLEWFKPVPGANYYIHCDLALTGDNAGISMVHRDYQTGKYIVDFMMEIITGQGKDKLSFQRATLIIMSLRQRGFNLACVTLDGWQSAKFIEDLIAQGIRSEILSVDTNKAPYDTLLDLMYSGMIDYYMHPTFMKEMKYLEDRGDKYDHPNKFPDNTKGSKDLADSCCGAIFNAVKSQRAILLDGSAILRATEGVVDLNGTVTKVIAGVEKEVNACYVNEEDHSLRWNIKPPPMTNRSAYLNMTTEGDIISIIGYKNDADVFIADMIEFYESPERNTSYEEGSEDVPVDDYNLGLMMIVLKSLSVRFVSLGNTVPYSIIEALRSAHIPFVSRDTMAKVDKAKSKHMHTIAMITLDHIATMCNMINKGELKFCADDHLMRELYELGETNFKTKHFAKGLSAWVYYNLQESKAQSTSNMPDPVPLQNPHLGPTFPVTDGKPKSTEKKSNITMPMPVKINRWG